MTVNEIFAFSINHGYILQIALAESIFVAHLERRNHFLIRLFFGLVIYLFAAWVLPNIIAHFVAGFFSFAIFLLSFITCLFLFNDKFIDILFCCVAGQLVQNISYQVESLIILPIREQMELSNLIWGLISVLVMVVIYSCAYFILAQRMKGKKIGEQSAGYVVPIALIAGMFVYLMQFLLQINQIDQLWVTRLPLLVCGIFGLLAQFGFFEYRNTRQENEELELFIQKEKRQYQLVKSSIEVIQIQAHDLKHYVHKVKSVSNDSEALHGIEEALRAYESNFNTGNKALDVVLTEKYHICMQQEIEFSVIAQADLLSFMRTIDIYAMFGNILENAIECESQLDKEQRWIDFKLVKKEHFLSLCVENYCPHKIDCSTGLPCTSKEQKEYHGFGLKSIQYIAERYGGVMQIEVKNQIFCLTLLFSI